MDLLFNNSLNLIIKKLDFFDIITLLFVSKFFKKIIELLEFDIDYDFSPYKNIPFEKFKNIKKIKMPTYFEKNDIYKLGENIKKIKIDNNEYIRLKNFTDNETLFFNKLESIYLGDCDIITDIGILNLISNNKNLKKISLIRSINLTNKIFEYLSKNKLKKLKIMVFKNLDGIENVSENIRNLHLSNCGITNYSLKLIFEKNRFINKLELNNLEEINDESLIYIGINIEKLYFENINITNKGFEYIFSKINKLKKIKLKKLINIDDNSIKTLSIFNNKLIKIIFDDIKITNLSLIHLSKTNKNMKYIKFINLSQISDWGCYELFEYNKLEKLKIKNIMISDSSLKILKNINVFYDYGGCNKLTIYGYKFLFIINENIKKVYLSNTIIVDDIIIVLFLNNYKLEKLYLYNNDKFIINENIKKVYLSNTIIVDDIIIVLFLNNYKLEKLYLYNNDKLNDKIFNYLNENNNNLKYLLIYNENIKNIEEGLIKLIKLNRIREITINKELYTEKIITELKNRNFKVQIKNIV